jgi:hypothetical protein
VPERNVFSLNDEWEDLHHKNIVHIRDVRRTCGGLLPVLCIQSDDRPRFVTRLEHGDNIRYSETDAIIDNRPYTVLPRRGVFAVTSPPASSRRCGEASCEV